jgi:hypothetical protein
LEFKSTENIMKPEEIQTLSIQKFLEAAQKEAQKFSDRELLVKTFGTVEWLKGVMGNGGGVLGDIRQLKKDKDRYVTRGELMLTVGIISAIFAGIGALIVFL